MTLDNDDFGDGDSRFAAVRALIEEAVPLSSDNRQERDERATLASHEAGHAVVDHHNGFDVREVSIQEFDGKAHSSATGAAVEAILDAPTAAALRPLISGAVAGIVAEIVSELLNPRKSEHAG